MITISNGSEVWSAVYRDDKCPTVTAFGVGRNIEDAVNQLCESLSHNVSRIVAQ